LLSTPCQPYTIQMYSIYNLESRPLPYVLSEDREKRGIPCFTDLIKAGFPSPAADYSEELVDFNEWLVDNPSSTFSVRVKGDSMEDEGIRSGDMLIVDRSLTARNGSIVVAIIYGEFTVKKLAIREGRYWLIPGNPAYDPLLIKKDMDFLVWGVVTHVIHRFIP